MRRRGDSRRRNRRYGRERTRPGLNSTIQHRISVKGNAIRELAQDNPVTLILFDLLYLDGYDLRGATLADRKAQLERIVTETDRFKISKVFATEGEQMLAAARQLGLEGLVAKDPNSVYESGRRSRNWWKVKVVDEQEFVIAGYTKGEREYFGALVLGVYEAKKLRHAGQVGTGFDQATMKAIHAQMKPLISNKCPLDPVPRMKDVIWLEPQLVCEVRFLEWTHRSATRSARWSFWAAVRRQAGQPNEGGKGGTREGQSAS